MVIVPDSRETLLSNAHKVIDTFPAGKSPVVEYAREWLSIALAETADGYPASLTYRAAVADMMTTDQLQHPELARAQKGSVLARSVLARVAGQGSIKTLSHDIVNVEVG